MQEMPKGEEGIMDWREFRCPGCGKEWVVSGDNIPTARNMSLRDLFAGMAFAGVIATNHMEDWAGNRFAKIQYDAGFAEGFAAGRREQARVDKQIINERLAAARLCGESAEFRNGLIAAHAILNLAALAAVAPKEGA